MYMKIALIFACETKWWENMFVAFLFRVRLVLIESIWDALTILQYSSPSNDGGCLL